MYLASSRLFLSYYFYFFACCSSLRPDYSFVSRDESLIFREGGNLLLSGTVTEWLEEAIVQLQSMGIEHFFKDYD